MIDDFITVLDHSLHGPPRAKRRLLTEARAGLTDAVQTYITAGMDAPSATARALADFGTLSQVRDHFQAELDIVHIRHMATLGVVLVPLFTLYWNVVWELNPYPTWPVPSVPFLITAAARVPALVASLAAAAALVVTGRHGSGTRCIMTRRYLPALVGTGVGAFAVNAFTLLTVNPETLLWPPTIATVGTAAVLGLLAMTVCRRRSSACLASAFHATFR